MNMHEGFRLNGFEREKEVYDVKMDDLGPCVCVCVWGFEGDLKKKSLFIIERKINHLEKILMYSLRIFS